MGKIKLFPTAEYSSKQPSDRVVPLVPGTGIFLGPSKSGKTVALISMIRVGRGGAAGHHPEAAQDHRDIQEVGDEEAVSGADNLRRLRR